MWTAIEKERAVGRTSFVYGYILGIWLLFVGLWSIREQRPNLTWRLLVVAAAGLFFIAGVQLLRKKYSGALCLYAAMLCVIADRLMWLLFFSLGGAGREAALAYPVGGIIGLSVLLLINAIYFERRFSLLNS